MKHLNKVIDGALADLKAQIVKEKDPGKLRDLVIEINTLLDIVEAQMAKIDTGDLPSTN
jgi:hypothetical protein